MRSQLRALLVGTVLGILVLGGCGVYGIIKPQGTVGDAKIVLGKGSGALFVVLGDTLHPVLNLASARLITGSDEAPKSVAENKLSNYPRGPLLGIPGAPASLPGPRSGVDSTWSVCDTTSGDTVTQTVSTAPAELGAGIRAAGPADAALVRPDGSEQTYLIYDGKRARVDTGSVPVQRGLGLEGQTPRPISAGLFNTFTEVDPLTVPVIAGRGAPGPLGRGDAPVGSVIKVPGLDGAVSYYVVLSGGVQRISQVVADIVRLADPSGSAEVVSVAPGALSGVRTVQSLPVADFPQSTPQPADPTADPVLCSSWSRERDADASTRFLIGRGLPLASGATPVTLTTADGGGEGTDQVYVPPGTGQFVQLTGSEPDSTRAESLFYVSDAGVRYGIADADTAKVLGLGDKPVRAPWAMVSLLAAGPSLSRNGALVSHDGMGPDPDGRVATLPPQGN